MFDIKFFIHEISKQPAIWDINCLEYKSRAHKADAWYQVVALMYPQEFNRLSKKEKFEKKEELKTKWRSLRDYFVRAIKAEEKTGKPIRKYLYFNQLKFLLPMYRNKIKDEYNKSINTSTNDDNHQLPELVEIDGGEDYYEMETEYLEDDESTVQDSKSDIELFNDNELSKTYSAFSNDHKALSASTKEENIVNSVVSPDCRTDSKENVLEDDDKLFLLSLAPMLKSLTRERNIRTRIELLEVVHKSIVDNA